MPVRAQVGFPCRSKFAQGAVGEAGGPALLFVNRSLFLYKCPCFFYYLLSFLLYLLKICFKTSFCVLKMQAEFKVRELHHFICG